MNKDRNFFPEIQGLRAIAVGLVVAFHVWPKIVSGGYVGVDVFFVVSGYLITGVLVRMAERDGRISLREFYSRRIRRLLPAATTVLMAVAVGTYLWIPQARWEETANQIAASALYVQNWLLALLSVDYLGAEEAASPVQHYWSLSVEEQFYIVWPLLMMGFAFLARRFGFSIRRAFIVALSLVFVGSLAASLLVTLGEPARAYFVTHTRMWELALGGLFTLTVGHSRARMGVRAMMTALGLLAIAVAAVFYTARTPFPGYTALLPTLGALLVIVGGDVQVGAFRGLNLPVLRYLGDRSYSIYLWHWPLVTFYSVSHKHIGIVDGLGLIAITLALSHVSYLYIEQRYRHPRHRREIRPLAYGFASILACVLAAGGIQYTVSTQASVKVRPGDSRYPGPAALLASADVPAGVQPIPPLVVLKHDLPVVYNRHCHQNLKSAEVTQCELGDTHSSTTAVLIGDSHAAQWVPALRIIADAKGWKLITLTKSACGFGVANIENSGHPYTSCEVWRKKVRKKILDIRPAYIFASQSTYQSEDRQHTIRNLHEIWKEFVDRGSRLFVIRNTPRMPFNPGDCLSTTPKKCVAARPAAAPDDLLMAAAKGLKDTKIIDMTDGICGPEVCKTVVGNMIVWRDTNHLTATYAAALTPFLAKQADLSSNGFIQARIALNQDRNNRVPGVLACEAIGNGKHIDRRVMFQIDGDSISYRFGDWSKKKDRYDLWTGTIDGDDITMTGSYIEGAGGTKKVSFSGAIVNERIKLKGKRGARDCTVTAAWHGSAPPA